MNIVHSLRGARVGAVMSENPAGRYAGDVSAQEAWDGLAASSDAALIDVRSKPEWVYVGVPVVSSIGKKTLLIEWDDFTTGTVVPDFIGRLKSVLAENGIKDEAPLYFICRSGNRSRNAAIAATAAGHANCFNIEFGFEGRLDAERHRHSPGSWKAEGLPWVQS
jgi:rhodanese-related sulfurtransferase